VADEKYKISGLAIQYDTNKYLSHIKPSICLSLNGITMAFVF